MHICMREFPIAHNWHNRQGYDNPLSKRWCEEGGVWNKLSISSQKNVLQWTNSDINRENISFFFYGRAYGYWLLALAFFVPRIVLKIRDFPFKLARLSSLELWNELFILSSAGELTRLVPSRLIDLEVKPACLKDKFAEFRDWSSIDWVYSGW